MAKKKKRIKILQSQNDYDYDESERGINRLWGSGAERKRELEKIILGRQRVEDSKQ